MRTGLISSLLMLMLYTPAGAQTLGTRDSNASHPPANTANTPAHREDYDPLLDLPPLPHNQVTLIGGVVASLDEVMNRMSLHPFGSNQKMEVRFDTRTKFYQDGKPISYRDIKQGQRVYVDTMLNGSKVFAKSIWIQSRADSGVGRGQIVDFDAQRGRLTVRDELSNQPIKMNLTSATVIRKGTQPATTADLKEGALVSLTFGPQQQLQQVTLLASPGNTFTFAGRVTYLDLSQKLIAIDNRTDRTRYDISMDAIPASILRQLHEGQDVTVSAVFDGRKYDARKIDLPNSNPEQ
ncbi:MAG TPA: hypothetical protein VF133_05365 [Terriglobales bacterium]